MLAILVFLPLAAFIAILLGAPARVAAIGAAAVNLALGLYAAFVAILLSATPELTKI